MSDLLLPNEPYTGDDALCAECGKPIKLSMCAEQVEGVMEAPDGLPAVVLEAICKECAAHTASEETRG